MVRLLGIETSFFLLVSNILQCWSFNVNVLKSPPLKSIKVQFLKSFVPVVDVACCTLRFSTYADSPDRSLTPRAPTSAHPPDTAHGTRYSG